jgi:hypothetical protein
MNIYDSATHHPPMRITPLRITSVVIRYVLQVSSNGIEAQPAIRGGVTETHAAAGSEFTTMSCTGSHFKRERGLPKCHAVTLSAELKPLKTLSFINWVDSGIAEWFHSARYA